MDYTVRVKPGSSKGPLVELVDDVLTIYLQQRAVDGQANTALLAVLAKHFDVPKSSLEIVRGFTSRTKVVRVPSDPRSGVSPRRPEVR